MSTDLLSLKELVDGQVDPYATVNEALRQIEGRTIRVLSRTTDAQPGSPSAGDTYIITGSATGAAWGGFSEHDIAHYYGGSWKAYTPIEGLRLWVNDEDALVRYDGSAWADLITPPKFATSGKTANFSVTTTDRGVVFLVDASGGEVTMSLPGASAAGDGFLVGVKKIDGSSNDVVVSRDGSDTIEGSSSLTISDQWAGTLLASDGTDKWVQIGGGSGGGSASFPFSDTNDLFANESDATKILKFALSGLTTGTTRTATWPDKSGTVAMLSDVATGGNASNEFDEDAGASSETTWGYKAGSFRIGSAVYQLSAGTITIDADATNYIYIDLATQTVDHNTTGFGRGQIPIREVVTDNGSPVSQTSSTDRRAWLQAPPAFSGALVNITSNVSLSNQTDTTVSWDVEEYDQGGWWAAGSPTRLTVPAGVSRVLFAFSARFAANGTGLRNAYVRKNGGTSYPGYTRQTVKPDSITDFTSTATSPVIDVSPGDYFELIVWQNSGGSLNLSGTDNTWFTIRALE